MAEVDGERGHGYFIPAKDSKKFTKAVNCEKMPPSLCRGDDDNACQGFANAMSHNSNEDKDTINLIWTAPSKFSGEVSVNTKMFEILKLFQTSRSHLYPQLLGSILMEFPSGGRISDLKLSVCHKMSTSEKTINYLFI